ncbi:helix-turn-helix transcriptional regulator [Streptomyces sp. TRM68367]|uniref:helix-turn-helix domain-containing protein n=1 Tax=Streptomyces sp. TRM68367 TaxID=2758415 RepID=UPI00165A87A7|nr:helix-turn-helix transcriptional regulator [Streptomyces sp. TRM68367]MBC9730239.1 helix-turn-helix domain-containing protein [Streptomyces sp. TRM68367]
MATVRLVPTVRRRRLGGELRRLRNQAGVSIDAATDAMEWDPSKLSRIENAKAHLPVKDVAPLLSHYGVEDPTVIAALEGLAQDANKTGWWTTYGSVVADGYKDYIGLEEDAESTHIYAQGIIPGLLQTGAYAREIIAGTGPHLTPEDVSALAEVRKKRQAILTDGSRPNGPLKLWAIIHEAVLSYRSAARPMLMREQLRHLLDMSDLPNMTIQVMPRDAPAHPGMAGPFHVVRFPAPWPTVINLENLRGGYFVEGTDDVKAFESAFELIVAAALPVDDSRETIKKIMEGTPS